MRKGFWILAGLGTAALIGLAWMFQWSASSLGGVEETRGLEETLGAAYGRLFRGERPIRVSRMPGAAPGENWRWLLEGELAEPDRGGPFSRSLDRMVMRSLGTGIGAVRPSGVRIRFLRPDGSLLERDFAASGAPLPPAGAPPKAGEPPPPPPPGEGSGDGGSDGAEDGKR